jgi:hypothetical protein
MRNILNFLKLFNLFIFLIFFMQISYAANESNTYISVETLLKENKISLDIAGLGGYSGECIDVKIAGKVQDTLFILIEPGRRFVSNDTTIQDILVLKRYEIVLPPFAGVNISVYGFCCQSSNHSPQQKSLFHVGFMAPETWVELAEFVDKNDFCLSAVQNAVWVLSNDHPVSSIYAKKNDSEYKLKKFVAELKKVELPWYSLTFKADTARLFSGRPERIFGKINYRLKHNTVISIIVKDENNETVTSLIREIAKGPGDYAYYLDLPVLTWAKGKYSVYIIENYSNIILRKDFVL